MADTFSGTTSATPSVADVLRERVIAVGYVRVSGTGQIGGDGPERQDEKIGAYAARNNISIPFFSFDLGVSGATAYEDRPGLSDLLIYLTNNPNIRTVLVERADRLARDLIVQELTIRECKRLNIEIIEVEGGNKLTDASDPTRVLIRQVLGAVSEWEKSSLVHKLRASRARIRSRTGKCEGPKHFGDKEGEEPVLARLLELAACNFSTRKIAKILNDENLPARKGKWTFGAVAKIAKRHRALV